MEVNSQHHTPAASTPEKKNGIQEGGYPKTVEEYLH